MSKKLKVHYKQIKSKDAQWRIKKAYDILIDAFGVDIFRPKTIGQKYAKRKKK